MGDGQWACRVKVVEAQKCHGYLHGVQKCSKQFYTNKCSKDNMCKQRNLQGLFFVNKFMYRTLTNK